MDTPNCLLFKINSSAEASEIMKSIINGLVNSDAITRADISIYGIKIVAKNARFTCVAGKSKFMALLGLIGSEGVSKLCLIIIRPKHSYFNLLYKNCIGLNGYSINLLTTALEGAIRDSLNGEFVGHITEAQSDEIAATTGKPDAA